MLQKDCFTHLYIVAAATAVMSLQNAELFESSSTDVLQELERPIVFVHLLCLFNLSQDASEVLVAMVCGVVLTVLKASKSFLYDNAKGYLGYIGSCNGNLGKLHTSLDDVCSKKDSIEKKVKEKNDELQVITREAACWLNDARILTEDEKLKGLMYEDIDTAKFVVKLMGNKYLKRRIREESEMQQLVLKVMKKLKEDVANAKEEMKKILEDEYQQLAEVVLEVMKDTIDEFKKLMKEDRKMAAIAIRTLKSSDLAKLAEGDKEIEKIVREARYSSDDEHWPNRVDGESNALEPLLVKIPEVGVSENMVKDAVQKLFTPLTYLVTPLVNLMDDKDFKKAVRYTAEVKLGLQVIDGLLIRGRGSKKEMDDPTKQDNMDGGCSAPLSLLCYYHSRYLISKAAESMVNHIQNDLISKCPRDEVTLRIRSQDLKQIPSGFIEGLESRTDLLDQILKKLIDDQVDSVGLFGMGGIGKTTLAKEVNMRAKDSFDIKVMVEISDAPDFVRIQDTIAESIGLPLHDIHDVSQRAIRLYNRLSDVKKEENILIILDNVWKKLNLNELGIPPNCKLLLTTRDREVCRLMDVQDANIRKVGVLSTNEARELFKSRAGNQVDAREYKNVVERLLSKCGGLPLAIVATANSLKDQNLYSWVKFADDLEKPISSQRSGGDYHDTFVILNTSYKFIQPDEKRIFFLLACLSPLGSSVSIESLMRYGMGLNLFEYVNKLSEAMEQAVSWANELMLASMLLEGDVKGDIKIHDIVRDFAISYAAKEEEHRFMVETVPRWMDDETLKKYTAMSLTSKNDYSRLSGVEVCKLQILILKGDLSPEFDDDVFSGMVNLKVLAVSSMDFHPSLPKSMRKLQKLKTLCMERCKLGNIELVGELVNLLILSLRESSLENLPNEIGNLSKLRLLDLNGCTSSNKLPLIPADVLNKLSGLEGLYMYTDKELLFKPKFAVATENYRLPYLNALEIKVGATEGLPTDEQFISSLDKFKICFGDESMSAGTSQTFSGILSYVGLYDRRPSTRTTLKGKFPNILLKKTDYLQMARSNEFEDLVPQFDREGFRSLRFLYLYACNDMKCIADGRTMSNMIAFPCLEYITLTWMKSLEMVCPGDVSPQTFANLLHLNIDHSNKLLCGLPLVPRNLKTIDLSCCELLKFVFIVDEDAPPIKLPFLESLFLDIVPCLLSLVGPKKCNNTSDTLQTPRFFFDGKVVLPSLEWFKLEDCNSVVKLWSKEISASEFQNLRDITIKGCEKLSSIGSAYVFSNLVQLENLSISSCDEMHEVISSEETQESEIVEQVLRFPRLTCLKLEFLSKLECFYGGESKLEFPKLQILILNALGNMKRFAKLEISSALFHKEINFPFLEELQVEGVNDEVMGLWDKQSSSITNPVPMLTKFALGSSSGLQQLRPVILEKLSSVTLSYINDVDSVFSSSNSGEGEGEGFVSIYSQLPNLESLKVENSRSLKELFRKEDSNAIDDTLTTFCVQIKSLELYNLPSLNVIPLHLFKSITSLTLTLLKWDYLISAHVLEDSLQQLQLLSIRSCSNMKALVINVDSQINFPSLKKLVLYGLESLIGISSTPKKEVTLLLPLLESLEIRDCDKLEHLWSGKILAPKLQEVKVRKCDNLKQVFVGNPEEPIELPSLQIVSIEECRFILSITSASLIAPKLREVVISECNNMRCFFPRDQNDDGDLQLLSLEFVGIDKCPKLHTFALRRVVAPRLTEIFYEMKKYSMLSYGELNHFLQKIKR